MRTVLTIIIIVLVIAVIALVLIYRQAQKMQLRQAESQKLMEAYTQVASLLIIDKKKMKLKEAPFPEELYKETPAYLRFMSVYVVKAKIGPRVVNLLCDKNIFNSISPKTTVTAKISGAYIQQILKGETPTEKELARRKKARLKAEKKAAKGKK